MARSPLTTIRRLRPHFVAAVILLVYSAVAFAQPDYKQDTLNPDWSAWGKVTGQSNESKEVIDMLSGAQQLNAQKFDAFFKEMLFPLFTQWRDKTVRGGTVSPLLESYGREHGPAGMRLAIKSIYANKATSSAAALAHEEFNKLTLDFMDRVANDNYHPVVRVNAMLMIADLNETDPNGAPWKNALPSLLKAASDPKMIDAVRDEALRGLVRHAKSGISPELRGQITSAMLAIIDKHIPPAGRTQEGHDWICRRAIDVLTALGDAGPNGAVPQSLIAIVNDQAASISIRCAAAEALGMLKITPPKEVDVMALAKSLGRLAVAAVNTELTARAPLHSPIVTERLNQDFVQISHGLTGENGKGGLLTWSTDGTFQGFVNLINKQLKDGLMPACDTRPLPQPTAPADRGSGPVVPIDTQKPIVNALNAAVDGQKTILERGEAAPAATTTGPAAAGKGPDFN